VVRILLPILLVLAGCATTRAVEPTGVAYAWATFDANGLTASGAHGLADRARGRALTIDDPARIASVTKLTVALAVMRLVEEGGLDLDRDVSDYLGWPLRNPAFPDRPITLRMLLSHTSSVRDEGDNYVVPLGRSLREMAERPASFDAEHPPGTFFRYSNLNFPLIGSIMERVTGERLDGLMARLVFQPLGLDVCMNWTTCSESAVARATVLYDENGRAIRDDLGGQRPACPVFAPEGSPCDLNGYRLGENGALFSPQGGLRISVRDLATVGRLVVNRGMHDGRRFLSEASIAAMARPVWRYDGSNGETDRGFYCAYGLAVQILPTSTQGCRDDLFGSARTMIGHAGDAYGVRSGVWIDPESRIGIAFYSTGNGSDPPRGGRSSYRAIEEALASRLRRSGR
jgi:CubicO group peptidase (beta-lactamase class C family)